jgi:hypothetical protein
LIIHHVHQLENCCIDRTGHALGRTFKNSH